MNKQIKINELNEKFNSKKIVISNGIVDTALSNDNIIENNLLIEIENDVIGDKEILALNNITKELIEKKLYVKKICVLLSTSLKHFASAFVSTLYVTNKSLRCEIVLYGNGMNGRIYELIGLMYSASLAPNSEYFFSLVTYDDSNPYKKWGTDTPSKDSKINQTKFPVSDKNLPLIPINEINNEAFFLRRIFNFLKDKDYSLIGGDYKDKSSHFYENLHTFTARQKTINYYCLHYFKLIDAYNVNDFDYLKLFGVSFRKTLEDLPLINVLILNIILDVSIFKENIITFYNSKTGNKNQNHSKTVFEEFRSNPHILEEFFKLNIAPLIKFTNQVCEGLYELAKNVVEHSSKKRGVLTIRSTYDSEIMGCKNIDENTWKEYFISITNEDILTIKKEKLTQNRFLDISIIDDGNEGIIETSIKELERKSTSKRTIPKEISGKDLETIKKGLDDQAKLLFNMYFNPNEFILDRQAILSMSSFGLFIFMKLIHDCSGIFYVETLGYKDDKAIKFYCTHSKESFNEYVSTAKLGTNYNIVLPVLRKIIQEVKVSQDKGNNKSLPNSLFQGLLRFNPIWQELKVDNMKFSLPGITVKEIVDIIDNHVELITVIIFKNSEDKTVDRSDLVRYLAKLITIDSRNAIIVLGINEKLLSNYLDLILSWASVKNVLLNKSKAIFFYTFRKEKENKIIDRIFALAGENLEECAVVNYIIHYNRFYQSLFEVSAEGYNNIFKEQKGKKFFPVHLQSNSKSSINPLFIGNNLIIKLEVLLGNHHSDGKLSYSENMAKNALNRSIDEKPQGYRWENSHLKIGTRLHLKDFVYGKKMFQKNYETSRLAFSLAQEFFLSVQSNKENVNYTFIGYGFYSELFVSQLKDFVSFLFRSSNEPKLIDSLVNYTIVKDEEEIKFSKYFKDIRERRKENELMWSKEIIVIVVPISSTLTTCLKIENAFWKDLKRLEESKEEELKKSKDEIKMNIFKEGTFEVFSPFYAIVVVGDGEEQDVKKHDVKENNGIKEILNDYWFDFDKEKKQIITINREIKQKVNEEIPVKSSKINRYLIYIPSKWQHIESCENCFPTNPLDEKPLFGTDKVSVTPTLVFMPPKNNYFIDDNIRFLNNDCNISNEEDKPILSKQMISEVHYEGTNKDIRFYLHYDEIFNKNKSIIENWASKVKHDTDYSDQILLIAPDKSENGDFIHLINRIVLHERGNIIKVDPTGDHFRNFDQFFSSEIDQSTKIFYIDNLLATGETFLSIFANLNMISKKGKVRSFDGVFCLINRMDIEVKSKLSKIVNLDEKLFSFISFNVPVIPKPLTYCPMCEEEKYYEGLSKNSSLDIIREYFRCRELYRYKKINKEDLHKNRDKNKNNSSLVKFALTHYLNQALAVEENSPDFIKALTESKIEENDKYDFDLFIKGFLDYIGEEKSKDIFDEKNDLAVKSNIIKILSQHPFKRHRSVNITVFSWVLKDLVSISKVINGHNKHDKFSIWEKMNDKNTKNEQFDELVDNLNYLKCLIKYGGILQIAYILSEEFIEAILKICNSNIFEKCFDGKNHDVVYKNSHSDKKIYTQNELPGLDGSIKSKIIFLAPSKEEFIIYCVAHIQKSLHGVGSRSIRLERNIVELLNSKYQDKSLLQILQLENTKLIADFIGEVSIENQIVNLDNEDYYKHNSSIKNFKLFCNVSSKNFFEDISKKLIKLNSALNVHDFAKTSDKRFEEDAKNITKSIADILGYDIDGNNGGGFFLYKYQTREPEAIVMGQHGNTEFADFFECGLEGEAIVKILLEGLNYIKDNQIRSKINPTYTWTNFSIINEDGKWIGQNGDDYTDCIDIRLLQSLDADIKRLLLYRISCYEESTDVEGTMLEGKAVFVFYDNNTSEKSDNEKYCIKTVRYIHAFRNKILAYFDKNYKNDSFRAWINGRQKMDYRIMLSHGIDVYKKSTEAYLTQISKSIQNSEKVEGNIKKLEKSIQYLTNKFELISMTDDLENTPDHFNLKVLKKQMDEEYLYAINYEMSGNVFTIDKELIDWHNNIPEDCTKIFIYPKTFRKELIFEIFHNISKHVVNKYKSMLSTKDKLVIEVTVEQISNYYYLIVRNSHLFDKECYEQIDNIKLKRVTKDGLSLATKIINNFCKNRPRRNIKIVFENNIECEEMKYFKLIIPLFEKGEENV